MWNESRIHDKIKDYLINAELILTEVHSSKTNGLTIIMTSLNKFIAVFPKTALLLHKFKTYKTERGTS